MRIIRASFDKGLSRADALCAWKAAQRRQRAQKSNVRATFYSHAGTSTCSIANCLEHACLPLLYSCVFKQLASIVILNALSNEFRLRRHLCVPRVEIILQLLTVSRKLETGCWTVFRVPVPVRALLVTTGTRSLRCPMLSGILEASDSPPSRERVKCDFQIVPLSMLSRRGVR